MADAKMVAAFRSALVEAYRRAGTACMATWRARRDADRLHSHALALAPSIASEAIRSAILGEVEAARSAAAQAEHDSYARRRRLLDLLDLMGPTDADTRAP